MKDGTARRRLHEAAVVSRALVRAQRRRRAEPPRPGRDALQALQRLLPAAAVSESRLLDVPGDRTSWLDSGLALRAGDDATTFATGSLDLVAPLDLRAEPATQLWFRAGPDGPVFRGTRATHSFAAPAAGSLELASNLPGEWAHPSGVRAVPTRGTPRPKGRLSVLLVRWAPGSEADAALRVAAASDPGGLAAAELRRRATAVPEPDGWRHLWSIGASAIFDGTRGGIACATHADVGILQREVDVPLTDATRLRWAWRVDELPSALAEDTLPTHDYLSIALEFDNGQDLTWHWSAELAPGYAYRCPIPACKARETHLVVRSGRADLGRWLTEEREVRRDYAATVGRPPERIVRVWLIAVSSFQRGRGSAAFDDIEVRDGERVERLV